MKYLTTVILSLAVLSNMLVSMFITDWYIWIHFGHKLQLLLVCMAGVFFQDYRINRFAFWVYFFIIAANWLFYAVMGDHGNWWATGFGFALAIIFIRIKELWKF